MGHYFQLFHFCNLWCSEEKLGMTMPNPTSLPKLVIFDCDGVVIDSEPLTLQLMRDDLASRGLKLSLPKMMDLAVGGTLPGWGGKQKSWVPILLMIGSISFI